VAHRTALVERAALPALRINECPIGCEATDDAIPLPEKGMPEAVFRPAPEHAWKPPIHLTTTGFKGVSSMHLHRDLDITQKSA